MTHLLDRRAALLGAALSSLAPAALVGCSARPTEVPVDLAAVKADLQAISQARILFAHQSVGRNILDGVRDLVRETGVTLRIERFDEGTQAPAGPGLFHVQVGKNGVPDTKIASFGRLLASNGGFDVALLKLCYEDVARDAQGQDGLLGRYEAMVSKVGSASPGTRLVHVTTPLRSQPAGWKTPLKRLLGREVEGDADNTLRNAYNRNLLARFGDGKALVFDLARLESTLPDGRRSAFDHDGKPVHTLAADYTDDGGHLNEAGRRHAAAAFVRTLVQALQRQPAG